MPGAIPYENRKASPSYLMRCSNGVFKSYLSRMDEATMSYLLTRVNPAKVHMMMDELSARTLEAQVGEVS